MKQVKVKSLITQLGWILLTVVVCFAIVSMAERKQKEKSVEVVVAIETLPEGKFLITQGDILTLLNQRFGYALDGLLLEQINVERIERVLKEDPFIKNAEAYVDASNRVRIDVTQRVPVLRIIDKMGVSYYLDKEGNQMPLSRHFTSRVLVATGNIPPRIPDFLEQPEHPLYQLFELAGKILDDPLFAPLIEQVYVNNTREYTLIPKVGQQKILLGKYTDMDEKLENLKVFYQKAIPRKGWQKYKTLDLRYQQQIVAEKT